MLPRGEDYVLLGGALTNNKNSSGHGILRQFWQKLSSTFRLQLYPICTEMPDFLRSFDLSEIVLTFVLTVNKLLAATLLSKCSVLISDRFFAI